MSVVNHPNAPEHYKRVDLVDGFKPGASYIFVYCDRHGQAELRSTVSYVGHKDEDDLRRWAMICLEDLNRHYGFKIGDMYGLHTVKVYESAS